MIWTYLNDARGAAKIRKVANTINSKHPRIFVILIQAYLTEKLWFSSISVIEWKEKNKLNKKVKEPVDLLVGSYMMLLLHQNIKRNTLTILEYIEVQKWHKPKKWLKSI